MVGDPGDGGVERGVGSLAAKDEREGFAVPGLLAEDGYGGDAEGLVHDRFLKKCVNDLVVPASFGQGFAFGFGEEDEDECSEEEERAHQDNGAAEIHGLFKYARN